MAGLVTFKEFIRNGKALLYEGNENFISDSSKIIDEWSKFIAIQNGKGLIPLFITGVGASQSAKTNENKSIPNVGTIIETLEKRLIKHYQNELSSFFEKELDHEIHEYFSQKNIEGFCDYVEKKHRNKTNVFFENHASQSDKTLKKFIKNFNGFDHLLENLRRYLHNTHDRTVVAKIFHAFQMRDEFKGIWKDYNTEILNTILSINTNIFYLKLSELYQEKNAICLTLNFDGLLLRTLINKEKGKKKKNKIFSLPSKEECEQFFLRGNAKSGAIVDADHKDYIEIQLRGDILYLKCDNPNFCIQKKRPPIPFANPIMAADGKLVVRNVIRCPSCGENMIPFLSFPGFYEKEKEMKDMLQVVWKYLAYRIGCVTVVGVSGEWDPLIIAFLGDLLSEREIPLLVIDAKIDKGKPTSIIQELVVPRIHDALAIEMEADNFMKKIEIVTLENDMELSFEKAGQIDGFWDDLSKSYNEIRDYLKPKYSDFEMKLMGTPEFEGLEYCAQLGLKSYWLTTTAKSLEQHNRLNHSLGVMKIASFLYDKACLNSSIVINTKEKQFLRIAAILHDIGHLPFSHLMEEVFEDLSWAPGAYLPLYSHGYYTENQIQKIFNGDKNFELKKELDNIGYSVQDLINLINGNYGVGYLDAIINSAVDADKIDYIFRDTEFTGTKIPIEPLKFLEDISSDIHITPEKFMAFSGKSAKAAFDLLKTRKDLYEHLYRPPAFGILDGITKHIITTYFIHLFDSKDVWQNEIFNNNLAVKETITDLGNYKIHYCINVIDAMRERYCDLKHYPEIKEKGLEYYILKEMVDHLKTLTLNKNFLDSITEGFNSITKLMEPTMKKSSILKDIESGIEIHKYSSDELFHKIERVVKTCKLRMPGILVFDIVKDRGYLSSAPSRDKRLRSDNTDVAAEYILMPKGIPENWHVNLKPEVALSDSELVKKESKGFRVFIYPLGSESEADHAKNLYRKLLHQAEIPLDTE